LATAQSFSRQFCLVSALYDFSFITRAYSSALTLYAAMTLLVSALYDFSFDFICGNGVSCIGAL